jgi:hypothetical protein
LFGDWKGWPENEREQIWGMKRAKFKAVNYVTKDGTFVQVAQGFWFSAHEQWKYMYLPYADACPIAKIVQENAEKARSWNSAENHIPGMYASVSDSKGDYASACGIQQIASQQVTRPDVITPYGTYSLILVDQPTGITWLLTSLQGQRMQNTLGSTESSQKDGTAICPLTTWDSKVTTVVSVIGGIHEYNKNLMKSLGVWPRFVQIVKREHEKVFGTNPSLIPGFNITYKLPTISLPIILVDFTNCV